MEFQAAKADLHLTTAQVTRCFEAGVLQGEGVVGEHAAVLFDEEELLAHVAGRKKPDAAQVEREAPSHAKLHVRPFEDTFCAHPPMQGAGPKAIQELVGHSTPTMTLRYMHLAPSALTGAIGLRNFRQPVGNAESGCGLK